jgi:hypothetical protein
VISWSTLCCRIGRRVPLLLLVTTFCLSAQAGGPLYVSSRGVPITWRDGHVIYYTDQGNLSALLPNAEANQLIADAWSKWSDVPLANLTVTRAGQLDEDVNGSNVLLSSGSVSLPADVKPSSFKALAIVYDVDGKVTDALLGSGAGAPEFCATNSVVAQVDRVDADSHIAHGLVVINGNCAASAEALPILRYQLVRAFGRILGLDYAQLNENVVTGSPSPTMDDYLGYPVMHPVGGLCGEFSGCLPNADVPRMDDRAALARLYPDANFSAATARIHGVVRFPDWNGLTGQGVQGVNVVARMLDPLSARPSGMFAASCVSGFLFRGNAGNPITGYVNMLGERWDVHGSSAPALEGSFDLGGLEIPNGYDSVTYELRLETINSIYNGSTAVGPYIAGQVTMPGSASPVRVTISRGTDIAQDFILNTTASEQQDRSEPSSFAQPIASPMAGEWTGSISPYGDRDFMVFHAEAGRSFTFDVTAVDADGVATGSKLLPVVGVWQAGDVESTPTVHETYFNTSATATTRVQASVLGAGNVELGIADYRGDGRPDFVYRAHLLYADKLNPARVGVGGSVATLNGFGFTKTTQVSINGTPVSATYVSGNQMVFATPALADGTYSLAVREMTTAATSQMDQALVVGSSGAKLSLINGANPQVPVGTEAPNPVRVQVIDNTSGTPVVGATILFSAPSSVALVGCTLNPCAQVTDQSGFASVRVQVKQAGASVITITLPTGGSVSATVNGLAAMLEITVPHPTIYTVSGATLNVPILASVVQNGAAATGKSVNFFLNYGTAKITKTSSLTGADGVATSQVQVSDIRSNVNISVCVAPANAPCRTLVIHPVLDTALGLLRVAGDRQLILAGSVFTPVKVQVTDALGNAVFGAVVSFDIQMFESSGTLTQTSAGETVTTPQDTAVVLSSSRTTVVSDANGFTSLSVNAPAQPVHVTIRALTGSAALDLELDSTWVDLNAISVFAHRTSRSGQSTRQLR